MRFREPRTTGRRSPRSSRSSASRSPRRATSPCGCDDGLGLTDIVRAVDANGVDIADLELHAPTLDDVFLAKTGRTLEGAAEEAETAGQEKRQRMSTTMTQVGAIARRSVVRTSRQPASIIPPLIFPSPSCS